eukprot:Colp12_sorted_trinity150504_noHs@2490
MQKLDVTGDGTEEVVVCGWDGTTYIINHNNDYVSYSFEPDVCAFAAGEFAAGPRGNRPCFVYVTFADHVIVYYDIDIPFIPALDLVSAMSPHVGKYERVIAPSSSKDARQELGTLYRALVLGSVSIPELQARKRALEERLAQLESQVAASQKKDAAQ